MIYYPVFGAFPSFYGGSMDDYLRDTVSFRKDVEGLSNTYRRNLYHNVRCVLVVIFMVRCCWLMLVMLACLVILLLLSVVMPALVFEGCLRALMEHQSVTMY